MAQGNAMEVARSLVREAADLPTLPSVVVQLMTVSEEDGSAQRIARIVESDPPLTAKILRIANSPLFAQPRQVKTVERAAVLLGTEAIKRHALAVGVAELLGGVRQAGDPRASVWAHSLATSVIARILVQQFPCDDPDAAVVGGLLHDLGAVMLFLTQSERYANVGAVARTQGLPLLAAEQHEFDTDHCCIGAVLAEEWGLPEVYAAITARHHDESLVGSPTGDVLCPLQVVHLANFLADVLGIEVHRGIPWTTIDLAAWARRGVDVTQVADGLEGIETRVNEATAVLGLEPIRLADHSSFVVSANREYLQWSVIAQQTTQRLRLNITALAAVSQSSSDILACQSAGEALDVFLTRVAPELGFERVAAFSVDPYRRSIVPRGLSGAQTESVHLPALSMTYTQDPCVQAAGGGTGRHATRESAGSVSPLLDALQATEVVVAPVVGEIDTYGIIVIDAPTSRRRLDDLDVTVLTAIGRQLGVMIDSAIIQRQLRDEARNLQEQAIRDGLTGIYNYRYFRELLDIELARSRRTKSKFCVLLVDLDHFKEFNDAHGHEAGNDMLMRVVEIVLRTLRTTDSVFRYGGEEFAVILPETPKENAAIPAEGLCAAMRAADISDLMGDGEPVPVTVSIGVAEYPSDAEEAGDLIGKADAALYRAKQEGRDRVAMA